MKSKTKHSIFFKAIVLAVAFALTVLCFPLNGLLAFADMAATPNKLGDEEDYHVLTIDGQENNEVNAGGEYIIPHAYIGGNEEWEIGKQSNNEQLLTDTVKLISSNVKVTYYADDDKHIVTQSADTEDVMDEKTGGKIRDAYTGKFKAENVGTYKITYSYTYTENGGAEITNKYEMEVVSTLSKASVNFNNKNISLVSSSDHISIVDYSVFRKDHPSDPLPDVKIVLPEVLKEDGTVEKNVKFVADEVPAAGPEAADKIVVISAFGGTGARDIEVSGNEKDGFFLSAEKIADPNFGDGEYNIKFDYYVLSDDNTTYQFVTSNTKTLSVYASTDNKNSYYKNYSLDITVSSDWQDNGETGVENSIPKPIGLTTKDSDPANEQVDVFYSVKVQYKATNSDPTWKDIKEITKAGTTEPLYSIAVEDEGEVVEDEEAEEPVLNADGTLYNPTKFKPLQDGLYRFIYTIRDFYGNTKQNGATDCEYRGTDNKGTIDKTSPTPMVFDASAYDASVIADNYEAIKDERYKAPSYATANGVVVYAIGMTDNHSNHDDEGVEMYRRVENDDGVFQFTIDDYDEYDLVFNYRGTNESTPAYENLINNNFNIRKETSKLDEAHKIDSDAKMLAWLTGTGDYKSLSNGGYRIVIDNANAEYIFGLFGDEIKKSDASLAEADAAAFKAFLTRERNTDAAKAEFETYKNNLLKLGFAYINVDKTFGYDGENGFGRDTFNIKYVAKDAAKNEAATEVLMTIVSNHDDQQAPTFTVRSSLKTNYLVDDVVTFDAPDPSDYYDSHLQEKVLYRYLDAEGKPVELFEKDGKTKRETQDLTELWDALDGKNRTFIDGIPATEKYSDYHFTESDLEGEFVGKDGYYELTNPKKSSSSDSYEIDLSEVKNFKVAPDQTAVKLQVLTYVYDDSGNATIFAESADILDKVDQYAPSIIIPKPAEDEPKTYYQGDEISLGDIQYLDDAVDYMTYDIKVTATSKKTTVDVPVTGVTKETSGKAFYTLHAGSFHATFAGTYQVVITVYDKAGHAIVYFKSFEVVQRFAIQPPSIDQTTLPEYQKIELEGDDNYDPTVGISIPTPKVSYEIPSSVTLEAYNKNKAKYDSDSEYKYVILGVKESGDASQYSVTQGKTGTFTPTDVGTYEISYTVPVRIYDFRNFEYHEGEEYTGNKDIMGEHLVLLNGTGKSEGATVEFLDQSNQFRVSEAGGAVSYLVTVDNTGAVTVCDSEGQLLDKLDQTMFAQSGILEKFKTLRNYVLRTNTYTVEVVDSKAPELKEMPYAKSISLEKIQKQGNKLTIYKIQPNQKPGVKDDIDVSKCSIKVTYELANGDRSSSNGDVTYEGSEAFEDHEYELPSVSHGTYTITYTVVDVRGNGAESPIPFTISVGDTTGPTVIVPENFVQDTYEIGTTEELTIDLSTIDFIDTDSGKPKDGWQPTVTLTRSTGGTVEPTRTEGLLYFFPLDQVGSYTLTIEVKDAVGNTGKSRPITFEVVSRTADTTMTYQIVGTVLIVISVLILAGVIIYFIVSKVKLDKELKK